MKAGAPMADALITELRALIPNPCPLRPFVCKGLPQSCNVLVIGDNPATQMGTDWWRWWNDETGFDLNAFERDYKARRRAIGKREESPTRRRLGILRDCGLACLETNGFANERSDGHGAGPSNLALLRLFIARLPGLRAVIAHGNEAHRVLARIDAPASIRRWTPPHFSSRGSQMTNAFVETLGHEVREWIGRTASA
jgi:hypothetical protein